jgi:hypothetical protein
MEGFFLISGFIIFCLGAVIFAHLFDNYEDEED